MEVRAPQLGENCREALSNMLTTLSRRKCLTMLAATFTSTAEQRLHKEWIRIAKATDSTVGAAVLCLSSGQLVSMNGQVSFPLASVCKVPIAMNILALVDERKLRLDDQIEVMPRDVWAGVSDLEKRWPAQLRFPLGEIVEVMVAKSDNTAVETLFRIGGGGPQIARRLREWKINGCEWIGVSLSVHWIVMELSTTLRPVSGLTNSWRLLWKPFRLLTNTRRHFDIWLTRVTRLLRTERSNCSPRYFAVRHSRSGRQAVSLTT